jgi:hypothetical protein
MTMVYELGIKSGADLGLGSIATSWPRYALSLFLRCILVVLGFRFISVYQQITGLRSKTQPPHFHRGGSVQRKSFYVCNSIDFSLNDRSKACETRLCRCSIIFLIWIFCIGQSAEHIIVKDRKIQIT